jgi:hypothetical protein
MFKFNIEKLNEVSLNGVLIEYLEEVIEAGISLFIIKIFLYLTGRGKDLHLSFIDVIKISLVIGFITFILEFFSPELKTNVKSGISFSTGSMLLKL